MMAMKFFQLLLPVFAGLWPGAAPADIAPAEWVQQALDTTRAPGIAMGVSKNGQVDIAAAGLRTRDHDAPVTSSDLWHIGSNTKSMTATLVARMVEAGLINWDDTIGAVLGDGITVDPAFADITYADLLTHRSGLRANIGLAEARRLTGTLAERDMMADRLRYAASVLSEPPKGEKGTFLYSNAGYVVVGAMLQQSTGQSWETLINTHVFDPLGMASAGFGAPGSPDVVDQPRGHRGLRVRAVPPGAAADNIPALGPAGTVHASVADMLTYLQAHALRDPDFLTADSWARLQTPVGDRYAMGWMETPQGWLAHDGSNTMWYATAGFVPGTDRTVFMAANFAGWGSVARMMARGAIGALED